MNYKKAFIFLTSLSVTFSILGGYIGYFLGKNYPGYYRSVFRNGNHPNFDPIGVGVAQGVGQGFFGGAIAAIIVIFIISKIQEKGLPKEMDSE